MTEHTSRSLPKWAENIKLHHFNTLHPQELHPRCGQCWQIEALGIAVEALESIKNQNLKRTPRAEAQEALRRIEALGKESK